MLGPVALVAASDVEPATAATGLHITELAAGIGVGDTVLIAKQGKYALDIGVDNGGELINVTTKKATTLAADSTWTDVNDSGVAIGYTTGALGGDGFDAVSGVVFEGGTSTAVAPVDPLNLTIAGPQTVPLIGDELFLTAIDDTGVAVGYEHGICEFTPGTPASYEPCEVAVRWTESGGVTTTGALDVTGTNGVGNAYPAQVDSINSTGGILGEGWPGTGCTSNSGFKEWTGISEVATAWGCSLNGFGVNTDNRNYNAAGDVLGGAGLYTGSASSPVVTAIPVPGADKNFTAATASVNDSAEVVGSLEFGSPRDAFSWTAAGGTVDLQNTSDAFAQGWTSVSVASDISDTGVIVGVGGGPDHKNDAFMITSGSSAPAPTHLSLAGSAKTITAGSKISLSATLTKTTGGGASGEKVSLATRTSAGGPFTALGTATTGAGGRVSFTEKPANDTQYKLSHTADAATGASTSGVVSVAVKFRVTATAAATKIKPGRAVTLTVRVAPNASGQSVRLERQVNGKWKALGAAKRLDRKSSVSFVEHPATTTSYRGDIPAHTGNEAGTSRPVKIRT
jgi:hypothetical protein